MHDDLVHLWFARLDLPEPVMHQLSEALSHDENSEATRFKFAEDRQRFIARRGILKSILAQYGHLPALELELRRTEEGKLHLLNDGCAEIQFSLSHSRWLAVYAVSFHRKVGVDVEHIDPHIAWRQIARAFFTTREQDAIAHVPPTRQLAVFFDLWTRKESVLKAIGTGLLLDPTIINVAEHYSQGEATVLEYDHYLWKMLPIRIHGFGATVSASGTTWSVQQHHWSPGVPTHV